MGNRNYSSSRARDVPQVVDCLSCRYKGSNPSIAYTHTQELTALPPCVMLAALSKIPLVFITSLRSQFLDIPLDVRFCCIVLRGCLGGFYLFVCFETSLLCRPWLYVLACMGFGNHTVRGDDRLPQMPEEFMT